MCDHSSESYCAEQYFHVVLFNYAAQGGSNLDETLVCDHSNESY